MTTAYPTTGETVTRNEGSAFDRVIAPLDREEFFSEFWGKSFLHGAGPAGRFQSLLSWEELNAILEQHRLEPPRFRLVQDGKPVDPRRFIAVGDGVPLRASDFVNCLSAGATLVLDHVDTLAPGVRALAEDFEAVLRTRTTVNLYAGWRTQWGFDLHWDPQETVVLQVSGRKHWKVYRPTRLHPFYPSTEDSEAAPPPTEAPLWEGTLLDGEMIYLPRGWWHVAVPLDEPSLHLTVTIVPPKGVDFLRWVLHRSKRHADVRINVPFLAGDSEPARYLARLQELLTEDWPQDLLESFLVNWEANMPARPRVRLPLAPMRQRAPITIATRVRLATARRLAFTGPPQDGIVRFEANGFRGECASNLVPALDLLRSTTSHSVRELCARLPDDQAGRHLKMLLGALAIRGWVWIEEALDPGASAPESNQP